MPPILMVAAAVVSAGAAAYGVSAQRKEAKNALIRQGVAQKKQEADARVAKAESKLLQDKTGADLSFGTSASDALLKRGAKKKSGGPSSKAATLTPVGGL